MISGLACERPTNTAVFVSASLRQLCLAAVLAVVSLASTASVANETSTVHQLRIPSQPLDAALEELGRQSGTQLVYRSRLVKGKGAQGVQGQYTIAAALDAMLAGSNLTYRVLNDNTIEVRRASADDNRRKREALTRTAVREDTSARGSGDPIEEVTVTATAEGVVAMRIETPLREIPQTVSLVTPKQIRVQNLTGVYEALDRVPGLVFARENSEQAVFLSRGYAVTSFHVDGSASAFSYRSPERRLTDLAQFERIEVLRGADGLFAGNGQPGASINLIRKRPRAEPALRFSAWAGSWDNYRVEADVTGPLALAGALRGRMVGVFHDQNSFFDVLDSKQKMLFGVLDYDAGPSTVVTLGSAYHWNDETPVLQGLPPSLDGTLPRQPRNRVLGVDWAFEHTRSLETYFQLQHAFGEDWKLKFGAARWDDEQEYVRARPTFRVNQGARRLDAMLTNASYTTEPASSDQLTTDFTLTGAFPMFGLRTALALGADYGRFVRETHIESRSVAGPTVDASDYRSSLYPDPRLTGAPITYRSDVHAVTESLGAFVAAKTDLTNSLSITVGGRAGMERYRTSGITNNRLSEIGVPWSSVVSTPYGAVMYEIGEEYSLYASYADIYRNPETDAYDLSFGLDDPGGPRVRADGSRIGVRHGVNIEAGIKAAWFDGSVNGALVGYTTRQYRVPLSLTGVGLRGSSASGTSRSMGTDLELSGAFGNWSFGGGYTFNEGRKATGLWNGIRGPRYRVKDLSPDTPKHLLKVWIDKELTGRMSRWTVGGNLRAQTSQIREEGICANPGPGACGRLITAPIEYNRYARLDLRASFRVDANWRVGLTVNNVFDERYYQSAGIIYSSYWPGEPRNYLLKVEGAFGESD